jgi:hypothetical protein
MRKLIRRALTGALAVGLALALGACGDAANNNDTMTGTAEVERGSSGNTSSDTPPLGGATNP